MKLALSQVPPLSGKALKSKDFSHSGEQQISARAALAIWIGLAAFGWSLILGGAALVF